MLERYLKAMDSAGLTATVSRSSSLAGDDEPASKSEKDLNQSFFGRLPNDFRQVSEAVTLGISLTASSNNPLVGRYRDLAARLMSARHKRNPVPIRHSLSTKNSDTSRFARILSVLSVSD
jgi:hypothetical protein